MGIASMRMAIPSSGRRGGRRPEPRPPPDAVPLARQDRQQQQRDDVGDLDHRVHRRAGGVLVRDRPRCRRSPRPCAPRIPCRRSCLPRCTSWRCPRRRRPRSSRSPRTGRSRWCPAASRPARRTPPPGRRSMSMTIHSTIGASTGSSDGMIISRIAALVSMSTAWPYSGFAGALHDAGDLAELPPHLHHHRAGGAADRGHAHRAEQVGQQAADEQADHHVRVLQRERARSGSGSSACRSCV